MAASKKIAIQSIIIIALLERFFDIPSASMVLIPCIDAMIKLLKNQKKLIIVTHIYYIGD